MSTNFYSKTKYCEKKTTSPRTQHLLSPHWPVYRVHAKRSNFWPDNSLRRKTTNHTVLISTCSVLLFCVCVCVLAPAHACLSL